MSDLVIPDAFKEVRLLEPLKDRSRTIHLMMGYEHSGGTVHYDGATHLMLVKSSKPADPNALMATKIQRFLYKSGSSNVVETFFILTHGKEEEEWYLVTSSPHRKIREDWGRVKDLFPYINSGEMMYFVYKRPVTEAKFELEKFESNQGVWF